LLDVERDRQPHQADFSEPKEYAWTRWDSEGAGQREERRHPREGDSDGR